MITYARQQVVEQVIELIEAATLTYSDETSLHIQLEQLLAPAGFDVAREVRLSDGVSRIDLLVDGWLGIEVKIKGTSPEVYRQLARYTHCGELGAVLLITTRARHAGIANWLNSAQYNDANACVAYQVSLLEGGL